MNPTELHCTFLTPAWVAGADQSRAEIRAPAIRGELRWWFRALGGSRDEERQLFGGVHGQARASAVVVRVTATNRQKMLAKELPPLRPNAPLNYLWYVVAAGDNRSQRLKEDGAGFVAPGSTFTVQISERLPIPRDCRELWRDALTAFCLFGSLGYRANRAAGAVSATSPQLSGPRNLAELRAFALRHAARLKLFLAHGPDGNLVQMPATDWKEACLMAESMLRALRQDYPAGKGGTIPGPLGSAKPRQGSAACFRPLLLDQHLVPAVYYTESVLAKDSQETGFNIGDTAFVHPYVPNGPIGGELHRLRLIV